MLNLSLKIQNLLKSFVKYGNAVTGTDGLCVQPQPLRHLVRVTANHNHTKYFKERYGDTTFEKKILVVFSHPKSSIDLSIGRHK